MSTLAHVFEAAGLATVVLASMRPVVERMKPPRALYGEFPLGRPLGVPNDPPFQLGVIRQALGTLGESEGPVLVDHPDVIDSDETPLTCTMPPRFDPDLPAAVDEANGLRKAYDRALAKSGVTSVGRVVNAEGIGPALAMFQEIAGGTHWKEADIPGKSTTGVVHDIRAYYEEAALELVDGPTPGGRSAEAWFYETTEAGKTVMAARSAIKETDAPFNVWFYMAPGHR